jgi:hypothetical protein
MATKPKRQPQQPGDDPIKRGLAEIEAGLQQARREVQEAAARALANQGKPPVKTFCDLCRKGTILDKVPLTLDDGTEVHVCVNIHRPSTLPDRWLWAYVKDQQINPRKSPEDGQLWRQQQRLRAIYGAPPPRKKGT